ncbi:MAG: hypothetical protein ACRDLB_15375 [Actinomycetota bacterium]
MIPAMNCLGLKEEERDTPCEAKGKKYRATFQDIRSKKGPHREYVERRCPDGREYSGPQHSAIEAAR